MTRDEAIKAAIGSKDKWGGGSSEAWLVNVLEALGVLKLEDPKESLGHILHRHGVHWTTALAIMKEAIDSGWRPPTK
jgi:hypothetical protein